MVLQAVYGSVSALCLGAADFMGRFSSRAIDHYNALLGMLIAGLIFFTIWVVLITGLPSFHGLNIVLLSIYGIATTLMTLLLYLGLSRGPISVVAPIVAAHPVLVIIFYIFLGKTTPTSLQFFAMAVTILGAILVAWSVEEAEKNILVPNLRSKLTTTILIALAACFFYAILIVSGQAAAQVHGQVNTLWMGRLVSVFFLIFLFAIRRRCPRIPMRWWPFLTAQGILDAGGYIILFAGSIGTGKEIVAVVASTFGAVTILLARFILKESINRLQWFGIFLIFCGVVVLSK